MKIQTIQYKPKLTAWKDTNRKYTILAEMFSQIMQNHFTFVKTVDATDQTVGLRSIPSCKENYNITYASLWTNLYGCTRVKLCISPCPSLQLNLNNFCWGRLLGKNLSYKIFNLVTHCVLCVSGFVLKFYLTKITCQAFSFNKI